MGQDNLRDPLPNDRKALNVRERVREREEREGERDLVVRLKEETAMELEVWEAIICMTKGLMG